MNHLVVFAKAPRIGRVKTRLARSIGTVAAWSFYRQSMAQVMRPLIRDTRWRTSLAVTPDTSAKCAGLWPVRCPRVKQGGGDLGQRMGRAMATWPTGPVVIIGTDIPDIRPEHIARAFALLARNDAVIGPAPDGGYWLIGLKRSPRTPKIFQNVRWSSATTLEDTLVNMTALKVGIVDTLADVDDGVDYGAWRTRRIRRRRKPAPVATTRPPLQDLLKSNPAA